MTPLVLRLVGVLSALMIFLGVQASPSAAIDLAKLNEPSAIGEMALGPPDAKVLVMEYASASCPHCAKFHKETFSVLKRDYIDTGKIRFVLREFPHNQAGLAGFMLARCAPKEKYFAIIDALFETQDSWLKAPADGLFRIAQMAGFTRATFDTCLKNKEVAKGIIAVRDRGANEFGVEGVPTLFINGQIQKGNQDIEGIKAIIDPLLTE